MPHLSYEVESHLFTKCNILLKYGTKERVGEKERTRTRVEAEERERSGGGASAAVAPAVETT